MPRLRTFIAIDTGQSIRDRIVAFQTKLKPELPGVGWVEPENLHVTLLYLGGVEDRHLLSVCRCVEKTVGGAVPFNISVGSLGCFPNPRRPRVLWAGLQVGAEEVTAIHDELEEPLLDLGCYRREERQYTPHVTLGRITTEQNVDELAAILAQHAAWKAGDYQVREILVMSSDMTPTGPIYQIVSRVKLKG